MHPGGLRKGYVPDHEPSRSHLASGRERNHRSAHGVIGGMRKGTRSCLFLFLVITVSISLVGEEPSCETQASVLTGKDGKSIWLNTKALIKRATHCAAPKMPALARMVRLEGQVLVGILVDEKGKVACARVVSGHPMLVGSALEAAKDWTFRPMKQRHKSVSFQGHLNFHFSTGPISTNESRCTVAHW